MQAAAKVRLQLCAVWVARILVGATFIVSGWSKAVDPWGFLIKVNEYLSVWGLSLPRELVLAPCIGLSCVEFCVGVLVATGSWRRTAVWCGAAIMAFMLPLTLYIMIADPVSDCGCFGDFIVVSNVWTFVKNVVLTALIVYLIIKGGGVRGIYPAPIQWLVIVVSLAFPLSLALLGFHIQPVADFRPYRVGERLFGDADAESDRTEFIYAKDGVEQRFGLDELPDSTWTFVDAVTDADADEAGIEVRDADGYAMNAELAESGRATVYLVVAEPDTAFLRYAHYANALSDYAGAHGVDCVGLAGASGETLSDWEDLFSPRFDIYSADDTQLKQLARGDAAVVYVDADGVIRWKRTLGSLIEIFADDSSPENKFASVRAVDDGRVHRLVVLIYILSLLVVYLLSLSPKILRLFMRQTEKNA